MLNRQRKNNKQNNLFIDILDLNQYNKSINSNCLNENEQKIYFLSNKKNPKNPFSSEEDRMLINLVDSIGTKNWKEISIGMQKNNFNRSQRQCRDRYMHYLKPNIDNNCVWSFEEDELLINLVSKIGHKWKTMENYFNRSEVAIRNRYSLLIRKNNRENVEACIKSIKHNYSFLDFLTAKKKKTSNLNKLEIPKHNKNIEFNQKNNENELNEELLIGIFDDFEFNSIDEYYF